MSNRFSAISALVLLQHFRVFRLLVLAAFLLLLLLAVPSFFVRDQLAIVLAIDPVRRLPLCTVISTLAALRLNLRKLRMPASMAVP